MKESVDATESLVVDWASIVSPPLSPGKCFPPAPF
jgi:hypothetical protein